MPGLQFTGSSDMFFAAAMTTMRTAFLVGNSNGGSYQTCFGQAAAYLWHPGQGTTWLDNGFSSANLINGTIRHNGVSMGSPGNTNRPTSATIASFHTTGNVSADQFSQDRTIGRRWIGYFSEILVYDSALSNENINLLLTYLSEKYGISVTLLWPSPSSPCGSSTTCCWWRSRRVFSISRSMVLSSSTNSGGSEENGTAISLGLE